MIGETGNGNINGKEKEIGGIEIGIIIKGIEPSVGNRRILIIINVGHTEIAEKNC